MESNDPCELLHAVLDTFSASAREGQDEMARRVDTALRTTSHALIQAGTGTGKSLGYLVPATGWAVAEDKRVIVSTATLALQRQIMNVDVPRIEAALTPKLGRKPRIRLLKGWNNYVCLRTLVDVPSDDDALLSSAEAQFGPTALGEEVVRARAWAEETHTGDRDDLTPGVSDRAWKQVSISKEECIGKKCALYSSCFPVRARECAEEADLVITNHAMIAVASTGIAVLPEAEALVIDEAHDLVDRVTTQLTLHVSPSELESLERVLRRNKILAREFGACADNLATVLEDITPGLLEEMPLELADALLSITGAVEEALESVSAMSSGTEEEALAKNTLRTRLRAVAEVCDSLLADRADHAVWLDENTTLYVAPLDVGRDLAHSLFEDRAVVLTSATLSLGKSFDYAARTTGLSLVPGSHWEGIDIPSPFQYSRQAYLYVAAHLDPPPSHGLHEAQEEELLALLEASKGGALGLFSSRGAAEQAAEYVRVHSDIPLLLQGEGSLPHLIEEFASDSETSLFGTLSLWQGVDVPGLANRLVIIDRIPFPHMRDPLLQARNERAKAQGRSGFMDVSVPRAAMLLAQGAGRLIRGSADQGVVAILDSRIAQRRYGSLVASSMPTMYRTVDRVGILSSLARLAERVDPSGNSLPEQ